MEKELSDFEKGIVNCAQKINSTKEQYIYIYDSICKQMDEEFAKNNLCDFQDDKCICQRNYKTLHEKMGCCYTFKYSKFTGFPIDTRSM